MISYNPLPEIKVVSLTVSSSFEPNSTQLRRGRPAKTQSASVDIRWLKMEEFLNSSALAPNSRKVYERELRRFLNWTELLWSEIKPRHFSQYKAYLMEEVRTNKDKPLSKSSVNSAIATLKSFFGWMMQTYPEGVATNPTVEVKFEKIPLPPAQSLTAEQMQQVWEVIDYLGETKERDRALVHLLSHGLRAGEIVALNLAAFDGKLLFIADIKNNEPRLVPLKKQSRQALQQYLVWREEQGEILTSDRPLILSHHVVRQGQRLSYHGIYFAVEKIGELAGIPDLHPHAFRHTYATELLLQGLDPTHARKLTGHKNELAFKRYTLRSQQEAAISAYYRVIGEEQDEEEEALST
jgi:integrase/recombinase XerD